MFKRPSTLKLFLSAAAGFLVAAALVCFPGPGCGHLKWNAGDGQALVAGEIYHHKLFVNYHLSQQDRQLADDLYERAIWLCVLQNEIDCLPFIILSSAVGPALLLINWRSSVSRMNQKTG